MDLFAMPMRSLVLGLMVVSGTALAGEQAGHVLDIRVASKTLSANTTHFKLSGAVQSRPACATNDYWAVDTDTPAGKSLLATLLAAQATNRQVTMWGTHQCTHRPDMGTAFQVGLTQQ